MRLVQVDRDRAPRHLAEDAVLGRIAGDAEHDVVGRAFERRGLPGLASGAATENALRRRHRWASCSTCVGPGSGDVAAAAIGGRPRLQALLRGPGRPWLLGRWRQGQRARRRRRRRLAIARGNSRRSWTAGLSSGRRNASVAELSLSSRLGDDRSSQGTVRSRTPAQECGGFEGRDAGAPSGDVGSAPPRFAPQPVHPARAPLNCRRSPRRPLVQPLRPGRGSDRNRRDGTRCRARVRPHSRLLEVEHEGAAGEDQAIAVLERSEERSALHRLLGRP